MLDNRTGVLLINLGTPDAPTPTAVKAYLDQFLMDPFVIDLPYPLRWLLVKKFILPRRSGDSAKLYQRIWTEEGSPLLTHTEALAKKVQAQLGERYFVVPCMRYGEPSIESAVIRLNSVGIKRWVIFPLYPQYSLAATESSLYEVGRLLPNIPTFIVPPFYDDSSYLDAVAETSRPHLQDFDPQMVLFSFHGLPERHVRKTDPTKRHCLKLANCCDKLGEENENCYRAQCVSTARALASRLKIEENRYRICFQSRLNQRWIKPFTDEFYRTLPSHGVRRVAVMCPSFVADCLETLEEVALRGRKEFLEHGGEELRLIPSVNSSDAWVTSVCALVQKANQESEDKKALTRRRIQEATELELPT